MRGNLDDSEILAERALARLETATTNFVLAIMPKLRELPKKEFEALTSALTKARNLLNKTD